MSLTSQLAVFLYGLVILTCLAAAPVAARQPDRRSDLWHWLAAAVVFAGLGALRLVQAEDRIRGFAREWSRAAGAYQDRTGLQIAAVVAIVVIGCVFTGLFIRSWRASRPFSRARLVLVSRFALLGLIPLFALRLVSLHAVDRVLYNGPIRLNWMLEGAISLAVGGSAILYARRKRSRPRAG